MIGIHFAGEDLSQSRNRLAISCTVVNKKPDGSGDPHPYEDLAEFGGDRWEPRALEAALRQYLIPVGKSFPDLEAWRPFFLCAFIAQLVTCWFGGYQWERLLWVCLGFASALEFCNAAARAEAAAALREQSDFRGFATTEEGFPLRRGI